MLRIDVLTIFPEMLAAPFTTSILGRAQQKGLVRLQARDLRQWAEGRHRPTDDVPYGGGAGMVMKVEPVHRALLELREESSHVVLLCPQGHTLTQSDAHRLSALSHLILVAAHYEGVDERIRTLCDEELSIGDFVLTGGEPAAWVVADAVVRLVPGVLQEASLEQESFTESLLEGPQYTRPRDFNGMLVPEILLSGDHERIRLWRRKEALRRTLDRRPDLLSQVPLRAEDEKLLQELREDKLRGAR